MLFHMLQNPFPPSSSRMGVGSSSLPVDFDSKLSSAEISRLSKRFKKLDTDKSGTLNFQELLELPQIKQNPLAKRIVGKLLIHIFVNPCTFIIFKNLFRGVGSWWERGAGLRGVCVRHVQVQQQRGQGGQAEVRLQDLRHRQWRIHLQRGTIPGE